MKKTRILLTLILLLALACTLMLAACDEEAASETGITSVELKNDEITLKASLDESYAEGHSGDKLYILALEEMDPDRSLSGAEVVAEAKVKKKMTFKFSLNDTNGFSRVAQAFVLAEKNGESYSAITDFSYISNPEASASKNDGGNSPSGIKGLYTDDVYGSALLGADRILAEARMDKLILSERSEDSVKFNFEGISYFYDKSEVEKLDTLIADANAADMRIYIRTVLRADESLDGESSFLYREDAGDAYGYLPNLSDEKAVRYIKAFYAFLADRYPVADFIIGERVNDIASYCNAGSLSTEQFEVMYSFWARLSHQMLRSVNSSAKIYIPVDNSWRIDASKTKIGAKVFLSRYADRAKNEGDFGYAVALNLGEAKDMAALLDGKGHDYSRIGVTNLTDMTTFMDNAEMRYRSDKRGVIIDGLSFSENTPDADRATYYTFAYYAACEKGFDAFFHSSGVNKDAPNFYYSVLMCGSSLNSQLSDYTDRLPEVRIPDFNAHITTRLTYAQSAKLEIPSDAANRKQAIAMSLDEVKTSDEIYNLQGRIDGSEDKKNITWLVEADASNSSAALLFDDISASAAAASKYIGITLKSDSAPVVAIMIKSGEYTFIGEAATANAEATYYFDISDISEKINADGELDIAICILENGDEDASIEINEIALYGSLGVNSQTVITIIIVAVVILLLVGVILLLVVKRKKKSAVSHTDED